MFIHIILEREEGLGSNLKIIMEIHTYAYSLGKILKRTVCEGGVGLAQRDTCMPRVHFERAHSRNLGCSCSMSLRHQCDSLWQSVPRHSSEARRTVGKPAFVTGSDWFGKKKIAAEMKGRREPRKVPSCGEGKRETGGKTCFPSAGMIFPGAGLSPHCPSGT